MGNTVLKVVRAFGVILSLLSSACAVDFVDLDTQEFSCSADTDCSTGRVCVAEQCVWRAESPFPAYAVAIRDTSAGESCDTPHPGTDLFGVAIATSGGPIVALGELVGDRLHEQATGDVRTIDARYWNSFLDGADGTNSLGNCPSLETAQVISLGCGGSALLTFRTAPWVDAAPVEREALGIQHEVLVFEHGRQCDASQPRGELIDSYQVRVCPQDIFGPDDSGASTRIDDCFALATDQTGLTSHPIDAPAVP